MLKIIYDEIESNKINHNFHLNEKKNRINFTKLFNLKIIIYISVYIYIKSIFAIVQCFTSFTMKLRISIL